MKKALELNASPGSHISAVCKEAAEKARSARRPVHFVFNDVRVTVQPEDTAEAAEGRWNTDREAAHAAWMASPERAAQEAQRAEELKQKMSASMKESATTEAELRDAKVPWLYTKEQLTEYVESLVQRSHDYGTCVYAMSMAAEAAFNYVSHCLGVTGFQASCADLDFIRRTRGMDGPFILLKAEDALYPQYDLPAKLAEAMQSWEPWLKEQAAKKLAENKFAVHPDVIAHWKQLVEVPESEKA